jgi:hypothetical protein
MQQQQVHFQRHWKLQLVVFGALLKRDADVVRDLLRAGPLELELSIEVVRVERLFSIQGEA